MSEWRSFPKPTGRVYDPDFLEFVRSLDCLLKGHGPCRNWDWTRRAEAHHAGKRPLGRKCDDAESLPLCSAHHTALDHHTGFFKDMDRDQKRAWQDAQIIVVQTAYELQQKLKASLLKNGYIDWEAVGIARPSSV